jgi:hypothetical protein
MIGLRGNARGEDDILLQPAAVRRERRRVSPNRAASAHWRGKLRARRRRLPPLEPPVPAPVAPSSWPSSRRRFQDARTAAKLDAALAGLVATDCAFSNVCFSASGKSMSGASERPSEMQHRDQRAMSVVGPATSCDCAAASLNTSRGTTARSNGSPLVANLISSGVVPKRKTSLWPEALSNCAPSSFSGAVMPPPVKTWSSAACRLAFGEIVRYMPSIAAVAVSENFSSYPFFPVALGNKQAKLA